jgi:predicted tellurium resistance membrane protein TerC
LPLLIVGLGLSIPLIIAGSTLLMKIMDRFPIIITLGAALLGFLAGEMFVTDPFSSAWFHTNIPEADFILGAACAVLVVVVGTWLQRRSRTASTH